MAPLKLSLRFLVVLTLKHSGKPRSWSSLRLYSRLPCCRCAALGLATLAVGRDPGPKLSILRAEGLLPLLALVDSNDTECERAGSFCIGSLAEVDEILSPLVQLGAVPAIAEHVRARVVVRAMRTSLTRGCLC